MNAWSDAGTAKKKPPIYYWRLWVANAVLVSAGVLFVLAAQYGTLEFFGTACLMALLPFIPIMVLVGGAGSTIFALSKVLIEKRALKTPAALALLVGPGVAVTLLLVLLGLGRSERHWLAYICAGNAPASASQVQVSGYSTFLREEWLATFKVGPKDFQTMIAQTKLAPVDGFEFKQKLAQSPLKNSRLLQNIPPLDSQPCFRRVFRPDQEHERGSIFAAFDAATATAVVFREYHDLRWAAEGSSEPSAKKKLNLPVSLPMVNRY